VTGFFSGRRKAKQARANTRPVCCCPPPRARARPTFFRSRAGGQTHKHNRLRPGWCWHIYPGTTRARVWPGRSKQVKLSSSKTDAPAPPLPLLPLSWRSLGLAWAQRPRPWVSSAAFAGVDREMAKPQWPLCLGPCSSAHRLIGGILLAHRRHSTRSSAC
jgi:hypothetical protein